jgi:hypothetical protein
MQVRIDIQVAEKITFMCLSHPYLQSLSYMSCHYHGLSRVGVVFVMRMPFLAQLTL